MDPYTVTSTADTSSLGLLMGFLGTFSLVFLAAGILLIVCMWRIFVKAGQPGWAALIPFYNVYILLKIINKPAWWMLVLFAGFIPVVGSLLILAWGVIIALELGRKFGQSTTFSVVALWLFSFVGYPMLAFGSAQYDPSAPAVTTFLTGTTVPAAQPTTPQAPVASTEPIVEDPEIPQAPQV